MKNIICSVAMLFSVSVVRAEVWINEMDYSLPGTDLGEYVELAGTAGTALGSYSILLYNGANGGLYASNTLSGTIDDESNGLGAVQATTYNELFQNGSPDGVALVKDGTNVLQFLSYGGTFAATNGAARGLTSVSIGVVDSDLGNVSVQLRGTGATYSAFTWVQGTNASPGTINVGQSFTSAATNQPPLLFAPASVTMSNGSTFSTSITATDLIDNDVIALTASNVPPGFTFIPATNNSSVAGTFTRFPTVGPIGTFTTFFYAVDNDGTTMATTVVQVIDQPGLVTNVPPVWINELHYDNSGGDVGEGVEIAGPAGVSLTNYSIRSYSSPVSSQLTLLSGTIDDEGCGYGAVFFAISGLGDSTGALALVFSSTSIVQFLSYEGTMIPTVQVASNIPSVDIGQDEQPAPAAGFSLQLHGTGTSYYQFTWMDATNASSYGSLNNGQVISPCTPSSLPPQFQPLSPVIGTNNQSLAFNVVAFDNAENDSIVLSVSNIPFGAVFNTVTNAGAVTNTFSWNPAGPPGVYTTVFYAADNDGVASTNVRITVRDPPFITITTAPQSVSGEINVLSIGGTGSSNVVGLIRWDNALTGGTGTTPASTNWLASNIPLGVGQNLISVRGSNLFNEVATSTVVITRQAPSPSTCTTPIFFQGFEGSTSDTWSVVAGASEISTNNPATDNPPGQRVLSGVASWQYVGNVFSLQLAQVSIAGYTGRQVNIRVSGVGAGAGLGLDAADFLRMNVSVDGGVFTPSSPEIELLGSNNAAWGFTATNAYVALAGENNTIQSGPGANGYTYLGIRLPDSATSVALRVSCDLDFNEIWNVDDISIVGCEAATGISSLTITSAPQSVNFITADVSIGGTGSANLIGHLTWTNQLTLESGIAPAATNWLIQNLPLGVGSNVIAVSGTNVTGQKVTDSIVMLRNNVVAGSCTNVITFQGFEAGDAWSIANGAAFISTDTGTNDFYATNRIASGVASWQVNNLGATLELAQVSIGGFTGRYVSIRLTALSIGNSSGIDTADFIRVTTALDGSAFSSDPGQDIHVRGVGASGTTWGFWATNRFNAFSGTSNTGVAFSTSTPFANYSTLNILLPDSATSVALRVHAFNNDTNEVWNVDDIQVIGCAVSSNVDSDGDGIRDDWESFYFGNLDDAGLTTDDDGDGFLDVEEYAADTIPTNNASYFFPIALTSAPPNVMGLVLHPTSTGRIYFIQYTTNLLAVPQQWNMLPPEQPGTGAGLVINVTNDVPVRSYRTGVRLP